MKKTFLTFIGIIFVCFLITTGSYAVWNIETVDATGDVGWYASFKLDSSDAPHIAYFQNTDRDLKYAVKSGGVWSIEIVDGSSSACGKFSSLTLNPVGNPIISYANYGSTIRCAAYNGASWDLMVPGGSATVGYGSSVGVGSDSNIHISYANSSYNTLYYSRYNGSTWSNSTLLTTSAMESSIIMDTSNNPWVAFVTNSDNVYMRRWNGAAWIDNSPPTTSAHDGYWPSLQLDTSGNPHISFCSLSTSEEGALQYYSYNGSTWTLETPDASANTKLGMFSSLVLDGSNRAHISYHDNLNWKLKYVTNESGSWQTQTIDSANSQYFNSSIDLDSSGNPHIAYYDQVNKDLKYAQWIPGSYSISGTIADSTGTSINGVYVFLSGNNITTSCLTDENGFYSFNDLPTNGSNTYVVTPLLAGYIFTPAFRNYTNLSSDQTSQDHIIIPGSGYTIGGYALDENNAVYSGTVTIQISGDTAAIITPDPTGYYSFQNLAVGGDFTITPSVVGREFSTSSRSYTNLSESLLGENFNLVALPGSETTYSITGDVLDLSGKGIPNATVTFSGTESHEPVTTGDDGEYSFIGVVSQDCTITVTKPDWFFEPTFHPYFPLDANVADQDFIGIHTNSRLTTSNDLKIVPSLVRSSSEHASIQFHMETAGQVCIKVYSLDGVMVNLLKDDYFDAGSHRVEWNALNDSGNTVASGIYFVDLKTPNYRKMKKICVVK